MAFQRALALVPARCRKFLAANAGATTVVEASSLFTETEGQLRERVDDEHDRDDSEDYAVDVDSGERWWRSLVASRALSFPASRLAGFPRAV